MTEIKLKTGSTYNPTGDPLFYCPYFIRIDAIISGNSRGKRGTIAMDKVVNKQKSNKVAVGKFDAEGDLVNAFESITKAAADAKVDDKTIARRIDSGKDLRGFTYRRMEEL